MRPNLKNRLRTLVIDIEGLSPTRSPALTPYFTANQTELQQDGPSPDGVPDYSYALDLSRFTDASFDLVLVMGPLYHLVEPSDRDRAIREALRVLAPGGLLFASFITRYAVYIGLLKRSRAHSAVCRDVRASHGHRRSHPD